MVILSMSLVSLVCKALYFKLPARIANNPQFEYFGCRMKLFTLMAVLLAATGVLGQCPFPAKLTSTGICPGGVLTVAAAKNISKIDWVRDGAVVSTVTATASYNPVGITVAGGNGPGLSDKQLDHPQGIFVDAAGNILVADQNNNRIQAWPVGATTGYT